MYLGDIEVLQLNSVSVLQSHLQTLDPAYLAQCKSVETTEKFGGSEIINKVSFYVLLGELQPQHNRQSRPATFSSQIAALCGVECFLGTPYKPSIAIDNQLCLRCEPASQFGI